MSVLEKKKRVGTRILPMSMYNVAKSKVLNLGHIPANVETSCQKLPPYEQVDIAISEYSC